VIKLAQENFHWTLR